MEEDGGRKTAIYEAFKGRGGGRRRGKIGEDGGDEEEEKSLTGDTSKALITAYFLVRSGKIKICIQEKLVLQEQPKFLWHQFKIAACAAASLAIGTLNGEQDT